VQIRLEESIRSKGRIAFLAGSLYPDESGLYHYSLRWFEANSGKLTSMDLLSIPLCSLVAHLRVVYVNSLALVGSHASIKLFPHGQPQFLDGIGLFDIAAHALRGVLSGSDLLLESHAYLSIIIRLNIIL
jgi:hypothetical protein